MQAKSAKFLTDLLSEFTDLKLLLRTNLDVLLTIKEIFLLLDLITGTLN